MSLGEANEIFTAVVCWAVASLPHPKTQVTDGPVPVVHQVKRDKAQHASGQAGLPLFHPERTLTRLAATLIPECR